MVPAVQIALDANDPLAIAAFWAEVLGYDTTPSLDTVTNPETVAHIGLVDPDRTRPSIFIQRVPEPKTVKNRVHLDLDVGGGPDVPVSDRRACIEAEVQRLVGLGASVLTPVDQGDWYWVVMADPEGNEFCVM